MVHLGVELLNPLLKASHLVCLYNEVEHHFFPVHVFKVTEKITLNTSLPEVANDMKYSKWHGYYSPFLASTLAMRMLACPSP